MVDAKEHSRTVYPDIRLVEHEDHPGPATISSAAVSVAEPFLIPIPNELPTQRHQKHVR